MNKSQQGLNSQIRNLINDISVYSLFLIPYSLLLFACSGDRFHKTSSGLEYKIYTPNTGPKAKEGDYLTIYLVYKDPNGKVLFDSHKDGAPWQFQLMKPPFAGSYEEGLTLLAAGDSASFLVSADSMFSIVFKQPFPEGVSAGSKLRFEIKLLNIESPKEAEAVRLKMHDERTKIEQKSIEQYLDEHHLTINPTPDGLYFLKELKSAGISPDGGSICIVEYTGKTLDGKVVESSDLDGHPRQVTLGQGTALKGWEEALLLMKTGEKATIILPSKLAYGEEGRRSSSNGTYDVYPYTPLVYELKLRAVK